MLFHPTEYEVSSVSVKVKLSLYLICREGSIYYRFTPPNQTNTCRLFWGSLGLVQGRFRTFIHYGSAMGRQIMEAWMAGQREATTDPSGIFGVPAEDAPGKVRDDDQ